MILKVLFLKSCNDLVPNLPVCGNMVIEAGEDCDCGFPGDCTETCCNPSTCKLNAGATCRFDNR